MKWIDKNNRIKIIAIIAFLLTIGPISWIVYGNEEKNIAYSITEELKEEGTVAVIHIELTLGSNVTEISSIELPDKSVLVNQKSITYEIKENGEYSFKVGYKVWAEGENQEVKEVEKQEIISYQAKNIQAKQEHDEKTNQPVKESEEERNTQETESLQTYATGDVAINDIHFPDLNFRNWLLNVNNINGYGADGVLTSSELANIIEIDVMSQNIKSLEGLKYFTSLISLQCHDNKIAELDVSQNTALRHFQCSSNLLKKMDLSQNTQLLTFDCHDNQITDLNISQNRILKSLYCDNNQLTKLDITQNPVLSILRCSNNQLTKIDLANNSELTNVRMDSQSIDIPLTYSKNSWRSKSNICYQLDSVATSNIAYNSTTGQFNTSNMDTTESGFSTNCIDGQGMIRKMEGTLHFIYLGIEINSENFPDENFRNWLLNKNHINGYGEDEILSLVEISDIKILDVSNQGITDLKGIEHFTSLTNLQCSNNTLTSLNIRQNVKLTELLCGENFLTEIDVSQNMALTTLYCNNNNITNLDIAHLTSLLYLSCHNNPLGTLDVSNNAALRMLHCYDNQLTELNVKNPALVTLYCYNNQLTKLALHQNSNLTYLQCYNNPLGELDVSQNVALLSLYCYNNQLSKLDIHQNTSLTYLQCQENKLEELDVSKNTALLLLYCHANQLSNLDIKQNKGLKTIYCYSNQLTELDVSENVNLETIYCQSNRLLHLDLSHNPNLSAVTANGQVREIALFYTDKWNSAINTKYIVSNIDNAYMTYNNVTGQFSAPNTTTKSSGFSTDCQDARGTTHTVKGVLNFKYDGFVPVDHITNVPKLIRIGETLPLSGTVEPSNATEKNIVWSIKNAGGTGATLTDNTLLVQSHGTIVLTATVLGGLDQGDYTQEFYITTFAEPTTLLSIPASIELEKVKGSEIFEAQKEEEVSILPTTDTDVYADNFYIQTDPYFYLLNTKNSDEWFTVQIYDESNTRHVSKTTPIAILNSTNQSEKFYLKAFKDISKARGIYKGTMKFIIGYGTSR